ncbi:MAG: hypothetical protein H6693_10295 [Candidatus Latescibacteria bacterium]|nr:hypothetical protein [Candidatus Latescibacterota bacterium]
MERYTKLLARAAQERPDAIFLGGDLLPPAPAVTRALGWAGGDFVSDHLLARFLELRDRLEAAAPDVFLILGNDDPRFEEAAVLDAAARGAWTYLHDRRLEWRGRPLLGYACIPPTPFLLKDWERYDVSRFVDPGCLSPEEGLRTRPERTAAIRYGSIARDLDSLAGHADLTHAICLFHAPPYDTALDLAELAGRTVEHVPVDPHVGSIAVRRFVEARQPAVTLHGHVHEAARLSGEWRVRLGETWCLGGAHDGPELALVRFDPAAPAAATRELL